MKTMFNKVPWLVIALLALGACSKSDNTVPEQNKLAFISDNSGRLYAANALSGTTTWTYSTNGGSVYSSPAVNEKVVVYADAQLMAITCVNTETGALNWTRTNMELRWLCSPLIVNDLVYIGCNDYLLGLKLADGSTVFEKQIEEGVNDISYSNGMLIVNTCYGHLFGIEPSGNIKWEFYTDDGCFHNNPAIYNKTVYILSSDAVLFAIDITDGTEIWSRSIDSYTHNASVVYNNGLLFIPGDYDDKLFAFDASDGTLKHTYMLSANNNINGYQAPVVKDGIAYVFSGEGTLFAFNVENETIVWQKTFAVDGITGKGMFMRDNVTSSVETTSSPVIANGYIYVAAGDKLYALDMTGNTRWQIDLTDGVYGSPVILSDMNKVYRAGNAGIVE